MSIIIHHAISKIHQPQWNFWLYVTSIKGLKVNDGDASQELLDLLRNGINSLVTYNCFSNTSPLTDFQIALMKHLAIHFGQERESHNLLVDLCPNFDAMYHENAISQLIDSRDQLLQYSYARNNNS